MPKVDFIVTYQDAAGVHHERPVTVSSASRNAGWRKAVAGATAKDAEVPEDWHLIFVRCES